MSYGNTNVSIVVDMNANATSKVSKVRYDPDKPHEKIVKLDCQPVQNVAGGVQTQAILTVMYNLPQAVGLWQSWNFFLLPAGVPGVAQVNKQDHDSCIISRHHIPKGAEKPSKKLVGVPMSTVQHP